MAGNNNIHRGQQRDKPVRDALRMEKAALDAGEVIDHPRGSLRWNAQRLLMNGELGSFKEIADRLDGKVPQAIVGDDEHAPIQVAASDEERVKALQALLQKAGGKGVA
jgi:hypothetical protein